MLIYQNHLWLFHLSHRFLQCLLGMKEFYYLAAISKACEVCKDFINNKEDSKEEFLVLDLLTFEESFLPSYDALSLCMRQVKEEQPSLWDEDFEDRPSFLGIEKFERDKKL